MAIREELQFQRFLAEDMGRIMYDYLQTRNRINWSYRPDGTRVTEADVKINRAVIAAYAERRRDVIGEEEKTTSYGSHNAIYLDPINDTEDFIRGRVRTPRRSLAMLSIADVRDGVPVASTLLAPLLRSPRMYQAELDTATVTIPGGSTKKLPRIDGGPELGTVLVPEKGGKRYIDQLQRMGFNPVRLGGAVFQACCVGDPTLVNKFDTPVGRNYPDVVGSIADSIQAHEYLGTAGLVRALGGVVTSANGRDLRLASGNHTAVFANNPATHAKLLAAIRS